MPTSSPFGRWAHGRVLVGHVLGSLLLVAFGAPRGAVAGPAPDEPRRAALARELSQWAARAHERGEAVEWREVVGAPVPDSQNGAPVVEASWEAIRSMPMGRLREPTSPWTESAREEVRKQLAPLSSYFQRLDEALRKPVFSPTLSDGPPGTVLSPGIAAAWRLLGVRAEADPTASLATAGWLLDIGDRWTVRTWCEGLYWDESLRRAISVLRGIAEAPGAQVPAAEGPALDLALQRAEQTLLVSVRRRVSDKRFYLVLLARRALAGEDPTAAAAKALALVRTVVPAGTGKASPPAPPEDGPVEYFRRRYAGDPLLLVRDVLDALPTIDAALEESGSLDGMRRALRSAAASAAPATGDFATVLEQVRQIRMARLALRMVVCRSQAGGLSAERAWEIGRDVHDPETDATFWVWKASDGLALSAAPPSRAATAPPGAQAPALWRVRCP